MRGSHGKRGRGGEPNLPLRPCPGRRRERGSPVPAPEARSRAAGISGKRSWSGCCRRRRAPREAHRTSVAGAEVMRAGGRRNREAPLETRPAAGRRTPARFPSGPAWTSSRIPSHPNPLPATSGVFLSTLVAKVAHTPIPSRSLNLLDAVWTQALGGLFLARGVRGQPQWTQGNGSWGPSATC